MNEEYQLHPLCTLFPRLGGSEFDSLCADIKSNGLNNAIVLHEGMILDGGNRYRACLESGVEPFFVEFEGSNIVSFILSANLHRRHLSPGQQAAIVASAQDWTKAQSVGNPQLRNVAQLETAADRAAQSGASHRTQQMADKVAKANPELAKKVAHGEMSLPDAVKSISPQKPKKEPEQAFDEKEHLIAELKDTVVSLDEENTRLKDAIATSQLPEDEIDSASEIIGQLRREVKNLNAELDAVKSVRDCLMVENAELKKQASWQLAKLKKAGLLK